ncbi:hypothetical protein BT96DRAFT_994320 [Gymnopus androsaceus JB14]|uniref:Sister chromatid cohesion protein DCC1 n=1 Tax=Gymnopus androsaceus JB14 TaxID=1447944 RepID=A0A6A4HPT7_9AGAR|nr:hypothetical protein BT96DRAFT_994320 [Gymnopus androsaceus JB14]
MADHNLRFSASSLAEQGSFKLMELLFCLKAMGLGKPGEDAVLCTKDKTYAIRAVSLSNSILVVTSPPDSEGKEYGEDEEDNDDSMNIDVQDFTYADAQAMIQASEAELSRGLRERRILQINESLRPISSAYLTKIIQFILNSLAALSLNHESVPIEKLCTALADEHDVPRTVSVQVMGWFGDINELEGRWTMNVDAVVREARLGILKESKDKSIDKDELIISWKELVGDKYASSVSLSLMDVSYLLHSVPLSDTFQRMILEPFNLYITRPESASLLHLRPEIKATLSSIHGPCFQASRHLGRPF